MMTETCRKCGRPIVLVYTEKGKRMPLDEVPNEAGNVTVVLQNGMLRAYVDRKNAPPRIGTRMMPHFATCRRP
jgi:hypothetical protein